VFCAVTLPFWLYDPEGFTPLHVTKYVKRFDSIIPYFSLVISGTSVAVVAWLSLSKLRNKALKLLWGSAIIQAVPTAYGIVLTSVTAGRFEVGPYANYSLSFMLFGAVGLWGRKILEICKVRPKDCML